MVKIRDVEIGSGMPKICVPLTGRTAVEILEQARKIAVLESQIVEWRVDYADFFGKLDEIEDVLAQLREILGNKILLFTFRTKKEGGEQELTDEKYFQLNQFAAKTKLVDLIDMELLAGDNELICCMEEVHRLGGKVILSNHDFDRTPEESVMLDRLTKMDQLGGDILKLAVMPKKPSDVLTLLSVTCKAKEIFKKPIVTMSMSKLGVVSRLTGGIFGSSITFASGEEASAPGQIPVNELKGYLDFFS